MTLPSEDDVLLLHNPRCSKSRAVKSLLEEQGISFTERLYLEEPLDAIELVELANEHLPEGSRILLCTERDATALHESASFWANYRLQDTFHYDSYDRLEEDVERVGITHVFLETELPSWYLDHPVWADRILVEHALIRELLDRRGYPLYEANGFELFRLDPASSSDR